MRHRKYSSQHKTNFPSAHHRVSKQTVEWSAEQRPRNFSTLTELATTRNANELDFSVLCLGFLDNLDRFFEIQMRDLASSRSGIQCCFSVCDEKNISALLIIKSTTQRTTTRQLPFRASISHSNNVKRKISIFHVTEQKLRLGVGCKSSCSDNRR